MIEIVERSPEGHLEIRATGRVTERDYEEVLIPAIGRVLSGEEGVRLLFEIGAQLDGYSAGALWADTRLGMRPWRGFDRIAVVTDSDAENPVKIFGFAMPCPVRTFDLDEADAGLAEPRCSRRPSEPGPNPPPRTGTSGRGGRCGMDEDGADGHVAVPRRPVGPF